MWSRDFTDELLALKRAGTTFDHAWKIAAGKHPPAPQELGGGGFATSLLELERGDSAVAWFKQACREAWENAPARSGGPSRLHLLPGLVGAIGSRDESRPARRIGSRAA
jgi:hypothetical protein